MILVSEFGWTRNPIWSLSMCGHLGVFSRITFSYANTLCKGQLIRPSWKEENSIGADWGGHSRLPPTDSISVGVCVCVLVLYVNAGAGSPASSILYTCVCDEVRQPFGPFVVWSQYQMASTICFTSVNKLKHKLLICILGFKTYIFMGSQIFISRCTDFSKLQMYKSSKIYYALQCRCSQDAVGHE